MTAAFMTAVLSLSAGIDSRADEGMWMVNALNSAIEQNMHRCGSKLSAGEIYSADGAVSLCDAVVSLEFGCTGSIVSDNGLVITNHHCAYADVFALSTDEKNYLEDGFWAFKADEEIPIEGKSMLLLRKVIDVTDEATELVEREHLAGKPMGMRKLSHIMETKYGSDSPYEAYFSSMWSGSKYYVALYEVYKDIRLVAAPPVCIAAFGGDIDNWDWPQHKCDFAMYRIYTAPDGSPAKYSKDNVPLVPKNRLRVSVSGYRRGDFAMVIGYPGTTDRYSGSAKLNLQENTMFPIENEIRAAKMEIMRKAMNADPSVRLKYSDTFFSLSNVQELYEGQTQCIAEYDVISVKKAQEARMQKWIDADSTRHARWGTLLADLDTTFAAIREIEFTKCAARECLLHNCKMASASQRINTLARDTSKLQDFRCRIIREYEGLDEALEKELFAYSLEKFYSVMPEKYLGKYQKEIHTKYPCVKDLVDYLWENSVFTSLDKSKNYFSRQHPVAELKADPLYRIYSELNYGNFNKIEASLEGGKNHSELCKQYTQALYQMKEDLGEPQYPNANSTMRLTYGTVQGLKLPGIPRDYRSYATEILAKYNPDSYEFGLNSRQKELLGTIRHRRDLPACFVTNNDITGGNSGSPVVNARGELIGLAFDGNKESLASDVLFTPKTNRCVCVDIRYVLWVLREYAGCGYLADEMLK